MLVSICFQIQILIGIVSCITRNGINFQRNTQYIFFENFNGGKIVSKYLVVKASLTNTLRIKSDITFSIFVQRKIGCIRKVMWNLQCSMKPVTLPCAQAPHHCLAAAAAPHPSHFSIHSKACWSAHMTAEQPLYSQ